jgi:hypothetical protein
LEKEGNVREQRGVKTKGGGGAPKGKPVTVAATHISKKKDMIQVHGKTFLPAHTPKGGLTPQVFNYHINWDNGLDKKWEYPSLSFDDIDVPNLKPLAAGGYEE